MVRQVSQLAPGEGKQGRLSTAEPARQSQQDRDRRAKAEPGEQGQQSSGTAEQAGLSKQRKASR